MFDLLGSYSIRTFLLHPTRVRSVLCNRTYLAYAGHADHSSSFSTSVTALGSCEYLFFRRSVQSMNRRVMPERIVVSLLRMGPFVSSRISDSLETVYNQSQ